MRKIGLFEAKQKLSELVERAAAGERIGITRRGRLAALVVPAQDERELKTIFKELESIRKRSRKPNQVSIRELIEQGRA